MTAAITFAAALWTPPPLCASSCSGWREWVRVVRRSGPEGLPRDAIPANRRPTCRERPQHKSYTLFGRGHEHLGASSRGQVDRAEDCFKRVLALVVLPHYKLHRLGHAPFCCFMILRGNSVDCKEWHSPLGSAPPPPSPPSNAAPIRRTSGAPAVAEEVGLLVSGHKHDGIGRNIAQHCAVEAEGGMIAAGAEGRMFCLSRRHLIRQVVH